MFNISSLDIPALVEHIKTNAENFCEIAADSPIKHKFIEAKVLVDRWNLVTDVFLLNPIFRTQILKDLSGGEIGTGERVHLWGALILEHKDIPFNSIIALNEYEFVAGNIKRAISMVSWE